MLLLQIFFSIPTETARASSVSDPHLLYANLDPAVLVNVVPDLDSYPTLKMNADQDPGEMLSTIF
jgi:hypothetical protein